MRIARILAVVSCLAFAGIANASDFISLGASQIKAMTVSGLNWKVGDHLSYAVTMEQLPIPMTMTEDVTAVTADGITLVQVIDMMIQKQEVKILIDPNTGKIKKMWVNGQEQAPPADEGTPHIIKQEEVKNFAVKAGTFDAIHLIIENDKKEQTEMWINPLAIPITGALKMIATQQGQKITMELTAFKRGN